MNWDGSEYPFKVWTAGRDQNGPVRWVTGDPMNFINWGPGQPNPNSQECIMLDASPAYRGEWADIECNIEFSIVCRE
jgi:hypothetical protein